MNGTEKVFTLQSHHTFETKSEKTYAHVQVH